MLTQFEPFMPAELGNNASTPAGRDYRDLLDPSTGAYFCGGNDGYAKNSPHPVSPTTMLRKVLRKLEAGAKP
jgi:hypothetical protein